MPVYQLIVGAHSQQPYRKIIYASYRLYLVQGSTGGFVEVQHSINRLIYALF